MLAVRRRTSLRGRGPNGGAAPRALSCVWRHRTRERVPVPETPTAAEEILMARSLPSLGERAGIVLEHLQMVSNERKGR